jgi:hypothetical protein
MNFARSKQPSRNAWSSAPLFRCSLAWLRRCWIAAVQLGLDGLQPCLLPADVLRGRPHHLVGLGIGANLEQQVGRFEREADIVRLHPPQGSFNEHLEAGRTARQQGCRVSR